MKTERQIRAQGRRIHDYYRSVAQGMMEGVREADYTPQFVRRFSQVARRKAKGGRAAGIGRYTKTGLDVKN